MTADAVNDGRVADDALGSCKDRQGFRALLVQSLQFAGIALLVGCIFFGIGWWRSGNLATSWAYLQGERLIFEPVHIELKNVKPNQAIERTVVVRNLTGETVTLLGSQKSCGCITLDQFPIKIEPHQKYELKLKISTPIGKNTFEYRVKIFTDLKGVTSLAVNVSGSVERLIE